MKTTYQVWGYDTNRNDFSLDLGEHNNLKIAISTADNHAPAIIDLFDRDKEGDICYVTLIYCAFKNDENETFLKQKFPRLRRF